MDDTTFHLSEETDEEILEKIKKNGWSLQLYDRTPERCLAAVKQDGRALRFVHKKYKTYEVCLEAIKNGGALSLVPRELLTAEFCLEAVKHNGIALKSIPFNLITSKMCLVAVKQNGRALEYVPVEMKSSAICSEAVKNSSSALEYVPAKMMSLEMCLVAVKRNGRALKHIPQKMKTFEVCLAAVENNGRALEYVPKFSRKPQICLAAVKSCGGSALEYAPAITFELCLEAVKHSGFSLHYVPDSMKTLEICLTAVENSRSALEYVPDEFKEKMPAIKPYEPVSAISEMAETPPQVTPETVAPVEVDSLYADTIGSADSGFALAESETTETALTVNRSDFTFGATLIGEEALSRVYYISDIHLDHKLSKAFPHQATKAEIAQYISEFVQKMLSNSAINMYRDYLLIAGDVSEWFEISKIFYRKLRLKYKGRVLVVLGNHELWNNQSQSVDDTIQQYRDFLKSKGIGLLHNDLFLVEKHTGRVGFMREERLKTIEPQELRTLIVKSPIAILGGIGFSGLCTEHNATTGLYRNAVKTLAEDMAQSERFEAVYKKIAAVANKNNVIVLTHTPKENWTNEGYIKNWIYVNGHTHENGYCCDDERTVFSDNQLGYKSAAISLKHFNLYPNYDIFKYYPDGKHPVSREHYLEFLTNIGQRPTSFSRDGQVVMLKKQDLYMFLFIKEKSKDGLLRLLNGGKPIKLKNDNIDYYYERMHLYSEAVNAFLGEYNKALKVISEDVKKIGGDGKIHGCIVDIDFFNHLWLCPISGTLTPYMAYSISEKWEYKDLGSLLLKYCPDLHANYEKLVSGGKNELQLLAGNSSGVTLSRFVPETWMYKPSGIIRTLQYLTESNVIKLWDEKIIDALYQEKSLNGESLLLPM